MGQHFTLGAGPAQIMGQHVLPGCRAVAAYADDYIKFFQSQQ